MKSKIAFPVPLAHSTLVVMAWNAARLVIQFAWIVMLARILGVSGYGLFSGIAGLGIAMSGLVGLGFGLRLYRDVSRDPNTFGQRWAQSMRMMRTSATLLAMAFVAASTYFFPEIPWILIACVAVAELVATPVVHQIAFAYAAHGRMAEAAAAPVILALGRLAAVILLAFFVNDPQIADYAILHLAATTTTAYWLHLQLCRNLTPPRSTSRLEPGALPDGAQLAGLWTTGFAINSIDKAVILRAAGADMAGQYTAAHRFTNLATLPIDALVTAAMPRLFRAGVQTDGDPRLLTLLTVTATAYGALAGIFLWSTANYIPLLIGSEFAPTIPVLQILAIAVPLQCLRSLGANVLLGFGWTRWRLAIELIGVGAIVILISLAAPRHGASGSAWALVAAEAFMVGAVWGRIALAQLKKRTVES